MNATRNVRELRRDEQHSRIKPSLEARLMYTFLQQDAWSLRVQYPRMPDRHVP